MEQTTLLYNPSNIYNRTSLDSFDINLEGLAGNKLFCTFSTIEDLDELVYDISSTYDILYGKIFILYIQSNNEYACTYNVDTTNLSEIPSGKLLGSEYVLPLPYNDAKSWGVPYDLPDSIGSLPSFST